MPRKTLQQRNRNTDTKINRVRNIIKNLIGTENPDDLMEELLNTLTEVPKVPQPGKFYIFVYHPKTPNIEYDEYPFVAVTDVYKWGFKGINFHWRQMRQYTWDEIPGGIYEIYASEVKDLEALPFRKIRLNN